MKWAAVVLNSFLPSALTMVGVNTTASMKKTLLLIAQVSQLTSSMVPRLRTTFLVCITVIIIPNARTCTAEMK